MHEKHIDQLSLPQARWSLCNAKQNWTNTEKKGKAWQHKTPRNKNHKAKEIQNHTRNTALERSAA